MVVLLKIAVVLFVASAVSLTVLQCLSVYRNRDAAIGPKLCLAEQLKSFNRDSWLHDTALLGAARLKAMLTLEPVFDVAVLATREETDALVSRIENACKMPLMSLPDSWEWSMHAAGTIFRVTRFENGGNGTLYHGGASGVKEVVERDDVLPPMPCAVGRATFRCPRDEHAFLSKAFGPHWKSAPLLSLM